MDFDLFELEDDDLLSSMCIAPTEETETRLHNLLPFLTCAGEDTPNSQFSEDSFVRNFYIFADNANCEPEITLTGWKFKSSTLNCPHVLDQVFNQARMQIQILWADIKGLRDIERQPYWEQRKQVTLLLHLMRATTNRYPPTKVQNGLSLLRTLLNSLGNYDVLKSVYMANSVRGNETDTPSYHFLHGFLEWQFLDLLIIYEQDWIATGEDIKEGNFCRNALFEEQYFNVLNNLVLLTVSLYKRLKLPDVLFQSPFPCTCIKECWLLIQFLAEKAGGNDLFWKFFNKTADEMKNNPEKYSLTSQDIPELTAFLLRGLARLQGYKTNGIFEGPSQCRVTANYEVLENTVDSFLNSNPSEEQLRVFICLLMPIVLEWWNPKADIPMTLWEYFYKKMNSAFFIAGSAPSNLAVSSSSGKGYLEKLQSLLENSVPDVNHTSFSLFTVILGKTIKRFIKCGQVNQMQKILGRIYSKFSPTKFLALNETGVHHLVELFLMLALSLDTSEVIPKLRDKLLSIPLGKLTQNRQVCLMKGHVGLLILYAERSMDLSEYAKRLLEQIATIKCETAASKVLADSLWDIFNFSELFDKGEHLLIDSWLSTYLNACTSAEQERLLDTLHNVFQKIKSNFGKSIEPKEKTQIFLNAFSQHVLPFVKQNFITSFSTHLPSLAADFCVLNYGTSSSNDNSQFHKLFKFFIESNCNNKQAVPQFLVAILSSDKACLVEQSTIIQVWLKSLVILSANNEDVVNLSKAVVNLIDFNYVSNLTGEELLSAKEPLCVFVSSVGNTFKLCEDSSRKYNINKKFNGYLENFDKWIADRNEKTEVSFRFYSFIAIVIFNCADIVYIRNKVTCFFHVAMTRYIIPWSIQVEKPPEPKLAQMIHKIWPVIVQGIGQLNFKADMYIHKTLLELIVKWTPHFKVSPNSKIVAKPFISCLTLENEPLAAFVFANLASNFLTTQRRQLGPYACLVITILQEVIEANATDEQKLGLMLKHTSLLLFEHLMMVDEIVPSRNMILELFRKIFNSQAYKSSETIRGILLEHLKTITVKHLSYFTFFYFELLTQMAQLNVELIREIQDFLKEQISIVENKRGGGQDSSLRKCFEKLNTKLKTTTKR